MGDPLEKIATTQPHGPSDFTALNPDAAKEFAGYEETSPVYSYDPKSKQKVFVGVDTVGAKGVATIAQRAVSGREDIAYALKGLPDVAYNYVMMVAWCDGYKLRFIDQASVEIEYILKEKENPSYCAAIPRPWVLKGLTKKQLSRRFAEAVAKQATFRSRRGCSFCAGVGSIEVDSKMFECKPCKGSGKKQFGKSDLAECLGIQPASVFEDLRDGTTWWRRFEELKQYFDRYLRNARQSLKTNCNKSDN